jgi:hypothetical protein
MHTKMKTKMTRIKTFGMSLDIETKKARPPNGKATPGQDRDKARQARQCQNKNTASRYG